MSETVILTTAYFGPVQYFTKFIGHNDIRIEQFDNYIKQTYRNRCIIAGANGPLSLTIPVKRPKGKKTIVKDVKIDYDINWRKIHHQGIISSYNSSPFFEYLRDDIEPFFTKKYDYLTDLNYHILMKILKCMEIECTPELTTRYEFLSGSHDVTDWREVVQPKRRWEEDPLFHPVPYTQVFSDKYVFIPNLSILDLIFNTGKEAKSILKACRKDLS